MTGLWVLIGTLLLAVVAGGVYRLRDGSVRRANTHDEAPGWQLLRLPGVPADRDRVVLVQVSAPTCARCPQARAVLRGLAADTPGIGHTEVDLADRPELASALRVRSTPTVIAFNRAGVELLRVVGVPRRQALLDALAGELELT